MVNYSFVKLLVIDFWHVEIYIWTYCLKLSWNKILIIVCWYSYMTAKIIVFIIHPYNIFILFNSDIEYCKRVLIISRAFESWSEYIISFIFNVEISFLRFITQRTTVFRKIFSKRIKNIPRYLVALFLLNWINSLIYVGY